jgi:predicted amidohydrolase YtcJ
MAARASDRILVRGTVLTMDDARRRADAIWIQGDRIGAVGAEAEVRTAAPGDAEVVDLAGATVLPGFIDAHCHIAAMTYLLATVDCSPASTTTIPGILALLGDAARSGRFGSGWVTGHSFSEFGVEEQRWVTRDELDSVAPDRPAVLYHRSMHACVVNSRALAAAGLDQPDDPPFGVVGRDANGRPDGRVFEAPMFRMFAQTSAAFLIGLGTDELRAQVAAAAAVYLREGVTSVMDADLPGLAGLLALRRVDDSELLPIRIAAMVNDGDVAASPAGLLGLRGQRFRVPALKIFSDGGMSSRTAAVSKPFTVPPYGNGVLFADSDRLEAVIRRSEREGLQVAIHSQGDRGLDAVVTAFERVIGRGSGNQLRHRIEHGGMLLPPLLERAAAIGIHVVSQPGFFSTLADSWLLAYGDETHGFYPFKSIRAAGLRFGGSSDAPVIQPTVREALRDAVLRRSAAGVVVGPQERLTIEEALEAYTRDASYLTWSDESVGTLEPGKLADLVVLGGDPTAVAPEAIPSIPVVATIVGGEVAFGGWPGAA